ncbi:MAG: hypothetical protein ACKVU1_03220 [bacterium]
MHLDTEQIQRVLHDEVAPPAKDEIDGHLAECATCRARVEDARREEAAIFHLLKSADDDAPSIDAAAIAARATGRRTGAADWRSEQRAPMHAWQRRAAAILIATAAAGAAYAAPGSPLPHMLERVIAWVSGPASPPPPAPGDSHVPGAGDPREPAGIAVAPSAHFTIRFAAEQPRGEALVSLVDRADIVVRVVGGAATFTTSADLLVIENAASVASYDIELPKAAPWLSIQIGERRLLLKEGDRVATSSSADPERQYRLSLAAPQR